MQDEKRLLTHTALRDPHGGARPRWRNVTCYPRAHGHNKGRLILRVALAAGFLTLTGAAAGNVAVVEPALAAVNSTGQAPSVRRAAAIALARSRLRRDASVELGEVARSGNGPVVPNPVVRRLRAMFRGVLFPSTLPADFVFRSGRVAAAQPRIEKPRTAIITFNRKDRILEWYVSRSGGPRDLRCPNPGTINYPATSDRRRRLAGRLVHLVQGAVGQSAWFCTKGRSGMTVEAWNDYSITGSALMSFVARATR